MGIGQGHGSDGNGGSRVGQITAQRGPGLPGGVQRGALPLQILQALVQATSGLLDALHRLQPLDTAARVQELARMLGGGQLSATSLAHAQEMLHP